VRLHRCLAAIITSARCANSMPPSQHFALSSRSSPRLMRWRVSPPSTPAVADGRETEGNWRQRPDARPRSVRASATPHRRCHEGDQGHTRSRYYNRSCGRRRRTTAASGSLQGRRQQARRMTGHRVRNSPAADRFGHRGCPGRGLHHRDDDVRSGNRGSKCPRPGPHRIAARQAPSFLIPPVPLGSQSLAPGTRGRAREASASIDGLDRRRELTWRRPLRPLKGRVKIASNNPMRDDDSESPE
jgi:hypothetical protein